MQSYVVEYMHMYIYIYMYVYFFKIQLRDVYIYIFWVYLIKWIHWAWWNTDTTYTSVSPQPLSSARVLPGGFPKIDECEPHFYWFYCYLMASVGAFLLRHVQTKPKIKGRHEHFMCLLWLATDPGWIRTLVRKSFLFMFTANCNHWLRVNFM